MNKYLLILAFAGFNTFLNADTHEDLFAELREETQEYYDYTFPEPTPVLEPIFDEKGIINDVPNKLYSHYFTFGINSFSIASDLEIPDRQIYDIRDFMGYQLSYEFIKLNNLYYGADYISNYGIRGFQEDYNYFQIPEKKQSVNLWNLENRLGFNFSLNDLSVSPYVGVGLHKFILGSSNQHGFKREDYYIPIGVRLNYVLSKCYSVGLNCKYNKSYKVVMHGFHPDYEFPIHSEEDVSFSGYEISMPFIIKRKPADPFYVKIEQHFSSFDSSLKKSNVGTKLFIGYAL
jgi:hypothetical protein